MALIKAGILFILTAMLCSTSAIAATSQWHDLGGGKVRLVVYADPTNSEINGVVEVQLEPGWSTYWRYPGSSGIPPTFDFSRSKGFSNQPVLFPTPALQSVDGLGYAGYKGNVSFPFSGVGELSSQSKISLKLLIGLCREVCIPAIADIEINGQDLLKSDQVAFNTVLAARSKLPQIAAIPDLPLSIKPVTDKQFEVIIEHNDQGGTKPVMFVEGPAKWRLLPSKRIKHEGNRHWFVLDLSAAPQNVDLIREVIRFTFAFGATGIEIRP